MSQERIIYNKSVKRRLEKLKAKEAAREARQARMKSARREYAPSPEDLTILAILAGLNSAFADDVRDVLNRSLARGKSVSWVIARLRRLARAGLVEITRAGIARLYSLTAKGRKVGSR